MQGRHNSSVLAMELCFSRINPLIGCLDGYDRSEIALLCRIVGQILRDKRQKNPQILFLHWSTLWCVIVSKTKLQTFCWGLFYEKKLYMFLIPFIEWIYTFFKCTCILLQKFCKLAVQYTDTFLYSTINHQFFIKIISYLLILHSIFEL